MQKKNQKGITVLLEILKDIYGDKLGVKINSGVCILKYAGKELELSGKAEVENFVKKSLLPSEFKNEAKLKAKLENLVKLKTNYKDNQDKIEVLERLFPNYIIFTKYYKKVEKLELTDKLYQDLNLDEIKYEVILKKIVKLLKGTKVKSQKKKVDEDKLVKIKQELINTIPLIAKNLNLQFFKIKKEEQKYKGIASEIGVIINMNKINEDNVTNNINEIQNSIKKLGSKVKKMDKEQDVKNLLDTVKSLNEISADNKVAIEYGEEAKKYFFKAFNREVQRLITESKIQKLDAEKAEIENEKCSFFSKILGKAKLKQAKIDNINLKKQLTLSESQYSVRMYCSIEDSLSDLYVYVRDEESATDIKLFLNKVERNEEISQMIDKGKLTRRIEERMDRQRNLPQLVLSKEKKNFFSKKQINLVEEKNNELKRVIQVTRANSLKQQNTEEIPIIGNGEKMKSLNKFYSNLNEINLSLQYQCG